MRKAKSRKVALLFYAEQKIDRDRIRGILRYAKTHPEWSVTLIPDHPANTSNPDRTVKADGLITNAHSLATYGGGPSLWEGVKSLVLFDGYGRRISIRGARQVNIVNDSAACGRLAATYLHRRGLAKLAYVGMLMPRKWSDERESAFVQVGRECGLTCAVYRSSSRDFAEDEKSLMQWLEGLPKPCGVLCANDARAIQVLNLCKRSGISVPGQLAVMGVDNNDLACDFANPPLTSMETDNENAGYLAAITLDRMMRGSAHAHSDLLYGSPKIIERDSTLDAKGTARITAKALDFIERNFHSPIDVADVAKVCGVSRRTLERRFRDAGLQAPAALLREHRTAAMRKELDKSALPIGEIFPSCGFPSYHSALSAFKRAHALTPREFCKLR